MTPYQRYFPWAVLTVAGIYLAYCAMPTRQTSSFELDKFAAIPVTFNGRVQPLDTVARNSLMIISGRQTFVEEQPDGTTLRQPAIRWLIDVWTGKADSYKVIRIENTQVLELMGLTPREGLRYSIDELRPGMPKLEYELKKAAEKDPKARDVTDLKMIELDGHLNHWRAIATQNTIFSPQENAKDEPYRIGQAVEAYITFKKTNGQAGVQTLWGEVYANLEQEYAMNETGEFNKYLGMVHGYLQKKLADQANKADFECFFNRFAPFYNSIVLYIFVFILACVSWLYWPQTLRQSAFALCILTFVVHSWALFARMYLSGRWGVFVTNLYSSAIFIGWGCVGVGLILEYIFPNGIGVSVGAVTGSVTLIVAHMLSLSGDTLEMLQAVLDTNFWLATHVTCVTFGYTATLIAGFLGIGYVLAGLFAPNLSRETSQNLTRMIYGVICFATLLSFTGTVLGGIWADESWGRFWGWDPKENGALLIVMMNALTLHARWGGMIKARGLAVLAILGNIVVSWSWFGTNLLGIGLHAYGSETPGAVLWMVGFVVSQLLLAVLGMFEPATIRSFFSNVLAMNPPPVPNQDGVTTVPS